MNNNKQTAIEWLVGQLNKQGFVQVVTNEEIEQAKEMEKQQIINANEDASTNELGEFLTGEQYYNQEYGKQ